MPTYEYECEKCKRVLEVEQRLSDPPLERCTLPDARSTEERWASFETSGGAVSWNGMPFFLHPDRCKCQDRIHEPVDWAAGYGRPFVSDRDPYPHRHYPQHENHPCARCSACEAYDPVDAVCGGPVRRLISSSTSFILQGKGWAKDGYK